MENISDEIGDLEEQIKALEKRKQALIDQHPKLD